ncbi:MAG: rhodanese-like domain-containing protein [Chitinophagaceae bacterium]|nr:rhodanese-like domain-containing protein [Chitinophagaceae bacterium]
MKIRKGKLFGLLALVLFTQVGCGQFRPQNWTADQLEHPAVLADKIRKNKDVPMLINVGPSALIPNSIDAGAAGRAAGVKKLKEILKPVKKDAAIVVYCGCCPYANCPNVRPAIDVLKSGGFTNYKLLDLPQNIYANWISKGYPTVRR